VSGIIGVSPDMRSGTVGKYPDGHILQCAVVSTTTAIQATGNVSSPTTVLTKSFRHMQKNPTLYIIVSGHGGIGAVSPNGGAVSDDQGLFEIYDDTNSTSLSLNRFFINQGYSSLNRASLAGFSISSYVGVSVNAGNSLTYKFRVWAQSAGYAQIYINSVGGVANGTTTMAIFEIEE